MPGEKTWSHAQARLTNTALAEVDGPLFRSTLIADSTAFSGPLLCCGRGSTFLDGDESRFADEAEPDALLLIDHFHCSQVNDLHTFQCN